MPTARKSDVHVSCIERVLAPEMRQVWSARFVA